MPRKRRFQVYEDSETFAQLSALRKEFDDTAFWAITDAELARMALKVGLSTLRKRWKKLKETNGNHK